MSQIVDPVTQPSVNSSITRVRPVFRQLLGKDPTYRRLLAVAGYATFQVDRLV